MRRHLCYAVIAVLAAYGAVGGLEATSAGATKLCTWAGTPAAPTGTFTIRPGLNELPSPGPLKFHATGPLGGECAGTMTFAGQLDTGATCSNATFEGAVKGLPGVTRFLGSGSLFVPSMLFNRAGEVVGEESAEILTEANRTHLADCTTPEGFTGGWPGMFSSVLELF